jgi:hypothetical protein
MLPTTPIADVREAATMAGAESFEVAKDGNPRICFRNGWGAARFLLELARKDVTRDWIKAFALWMRRETGGTDEAFARALHNYGKSLPFFHETGEIFQGPQVTAKSGGDCDCHARLIYAIAKAAGIPTELAFLHKGDNPTHVYVRVYVGNRWTPIETTVDAAFGEDPFAAARRLGVVREDIGSPETITMGEGDNGECPETAVDVTGDEDTETMGAITRPDITSETAQLDDGFFSAIVNGERTDGGTAEMRAGLLLAESGLNPRAINSIGCAGLNQFCPGTLQSFFRGTPNEYAALAASQQMQLIRRFWQGHAASHGKSVYAGNGRNLYWVNFLPDSYNGGVDDSWLIAFGPRTGNDKDPSTWDPAHDSYIRANGDRVHFGSLLKSNPSFVTNEGSQRVIRASALTNAINNAIRNNPHRWAETLARINFARGGGGPPRSAGAVAAMFVGAGALGALAKYWLT